MIHFALKQSECYFEFGKCCMRRKFQNKKGGDINIIIKKCRYCLKPGNPQTRQNKTVPSPLSDFHMPATQSIVDELLVSPILPIIITIISLPRGDTAINGHCMGIHGDQTRYQNDGQVFTPSCQRMCYFSYKKKYTQRIKASFYNKKNSTTAYASF